MRRLRPAREQIRVKIGSNEAHSLPKSPGDFVREEKVAVGTPDMVIEQLTRMRDALSLSGVVAELNAGEELPPDKIASSLRLLCEEVMPAFK